MPFWLSPLHLSNKYKNKVTKKITHGPLTFSIQLRRTYQYFSTQADPTRETEFEVIHIPGKKVLHIRKFKTQWCLFLAILYKFDRGVTWRSELKVRCFKLQCSKCHRAMSSFLVINFCSYCSNVEQNLS